MSTILVDQIRVSVRIEKSVDHASSRSDLGPGFYNGFCRIEGSKWMARIVQSDQPQRYLLPPDLRDWLPDDDLVHFVVEAVERVPMLAFDGVHSIS